MHDLKILKSQNRKFKMLADFKIFESQDYESWGFQNSHTSTDFGIFADVSIFETGLDWLFLLINWTKREVLKDKALLYSNEYE